MANLKQITEEFKKLNHYEKIISLLDNKDYYKIASTTYEAVCNIPLNMPMVKKSEPKSATVSDVHRTQGNEAYLHENYGSALQRYNLAILNAPLDSRSFILALGNRSALFCKIKKFSAALKDIDTCLAMNCPNELQQKLYKRKEKCEALMWQEDVEHNNVLGNFNDEKASEDFYKVTGKRNPKFPFAKNSIDIVMKNGKEVVVAQSDIKVGEIVAIETSYINSYMSNNKLLYCYHCNKCPDNLIPCPTCAHVLYCDEACKNQCWEDRHGIECSMSEIMDQLPIWLDIWLKFVLKTWNASKDLEQFTKISDKIDKLMQEQEGHCELEFNNVESYLLPPQKKQIKKYGILYLSAIITSLVIHGLKNVPASVLKTSNKKALIKNIAKQVMYHVMHMPFFITSSAHLELDEGKVSTDDAAALGFYPLISRTQHSCYPNILMVGIANEVALISITPIKAGSELTIAHGGNVYNSTKIERQFSIYNLYGFLCNCQACNEDWQGEPLVLLAEEARAAVDRLHWVNGTKAKFDMICDGLAHHSNDRKSRAYQLHRVLFRQFVGVYQYGVTRQRFVGMAAQFRGQDVVE